MDENDEQTVIVDEIYLIALQAKISIMRETLEKIVNGDDTFGVYCLDDAVILAKNTLDKVNNM